MKLKLRSVTDSDLESVNRIMSRTTPWTEYDSIYRIGKEEVGEADSFIIACIDGVVAGFVWTLPNGAFGKSGYIKLIGVDEQYQGRGVGTALMDAAEEFVRTETTVDDMFLLVSGFNTEAQGFYRNRGYTQIGTIPNYIQTGIDEYVFRKIVT